MKLCLFFILGIIGCGVLGLIALFMAADKAAEWEDNKLENDRREP